MDTGEIFGPKAVRWRNLDRFGGSVPSGSLIGIYDLPVGSDLQVVKDELGIRIVETATGREIPREEQYGFGGSSS